MRPSVQNVTNVKTNTLYLSIKTVERVEFTQMGEQRLKIVSIALTVILMYKAKDARFVQQERLLQQMD